MTEATSIPPAPDESGYPLPGSVAQPDFAAGESEPLITEIRQLHREKDAVLVEHYYTDDDLQMIAD